MKPGEANKKGLESLLRQIFGSDDVVCEHKFHPVRRWRFDYAVPSEKIAVEYHGHGGFIGKGASGHSTIKGLTNDCEKANAAHALGWRVLAFTALHFSDKGRIKHNLTCPELTIMALLAGMQEEREKSSQK